MVKRVTQVAGTKLFVCPIPDTSFRKNSSGTVINNSSATSLKANAVRGDIVTISTAVTSEIKGFDGNNLPNAAKAANAVLVCLKGGTNLAAQRWLYLGNALEADIDGTGASDTSVLTITKWTDSLIATANSGLRDATKFVFTEIHELQDVGEYGREYNVVTYSSLANRGTLKFKGTYNDGTFASPLGRNDLDIGQAALKLLSEVDYHGLFRIDFVDGTSDYLLGLVTSFRGQGGGLEATLFKNLSVELSRSPLELN